jgi:ABC-type transporter Mla subunit MlaD
VRRHKPRISNSQAAWIAIVVIGIACYFVFGGSVPFQSAGFQLRAVFTSPTNLHIPSPVRIAGVEVGQVTGVQRVRGSRNAGVVTMTINPNGLPIHRDATVLIRSRIFLEGNFYVELRPGTPGAPIMRSGGTIPAANTSGPVQLDRVLSSLDISARENLQALLRGFGAALSAPPTPAQDATQDPSMRGLTGAQALNKSLQYSAQAFKASAIVNQALLGTRPGDLTGVIVGNERVFRALAASGPQLTSFVHTFNATMATLASRQTELKQTIAVLPPLLRTTISTDAALDASFPPTQEFARAILPGTRVVDSTIGLALPWIAALTKLNSPHYLGNLLADLTPAVDNTASSLQSTQTLITRLDSLARCFTHTIIPTGNAVIQDPPNTSGKRVYQELWQTAVGLAGASQNFDGNGMYTRASVAGGLIPIQTGNVGQTGPLFGNAVLPPLGTRPTYNGKAPPLNRSVACFRNAPPNLSAATGVGP